MGTPVSKKDTSDSVKVAIISGIFGAVITPLVVQVLIPTILKWSTPGVPGISFLWAVIGGVAGVLLGYFLIHPWFFSPCPLFAPTSVTIISPTEDSTVPRSITVQGTACHIPREKELWLLVLVGISSYYPQRGPVVVMRDGRWSAGVHIGREGRSDVGKGYVVCTALVDQEGRVAIQKYLESAPNSKTPLQPPLKEIELISQVRVVRG